MFCPDKFLPLNHFGFLMRVMSLSAMELLCWTSCVAATPYNNNNNIFRFLFIVPYKTLNPCLTGLSIQGSSRVTSKKFIFSFYVAKIC